MISERAKIAPTARIGEGTRIGDHAEIGDGAVIDHQFNTTDVCIVVKTDQVTEKYYRHYDRKNRDAGTG